MRKIVHITSALLVSASLAGTAVASTNDCSISNTGPDSLNVCKNVETNDLTISCTNNVDVVFVNGQNAGSGSVTLSKNTSGGFAFSGNAVNTNNSQLGLDVSCAKAKQTSVTPPSNNHGKTKKLAPNAPVAQALPNTGSNTAAEVAAGATAVFAGLAFASRFGVTIYRKLF